MSGRREDGGMRLALGPLLYYWPADRVRTFYEAVAQWPVDVVYLGETVCAKRRDLGPDDWVGLAERLAASGKEVVLSTLALLEAGSELSTLGRICDNGRFMVEANDMGAVHLLADRVPFVAGPHLNVYNAEALALLAECGARRWVPPVELPGTTVAELVASAPVGLEVELFAYGRLPLAFSARCFTARAHDVAKDACEFRCRDYPEGMTLRTQEDANLFTINGIQLQSHAPCNLLDDLAAVRATGVSLLRVSPQGEETGDVVHAFRAALDGGAGAPGLAPPAVSGWCNGYWHGEAGMARVPVAGEESPPPPAG